MQEKIVDYFMKIKTNWIFVMIVLSASFIDASIKDNFLADLNQGTSVIYWSENNGEGNEEEFLREFRRLDHTIQKNSLTSWHHHENSVRNDSFPRKSGENDVRPIFSDEHTTDIENDTTKICYCTIS